MATFHLGDTVRIKSGAFQSFTGKIDGINQSRLLLKVKVELFGKPYPLKLKFSEVEKIDFTPERPTQSDS